MAIEFKLTKKQFRLWDNFCLNNGKEMYENKDAYMNVYDNKTKHYSVIVSHNEQTGIIKFLEKVLDTHLKSEYNLEH
jgi:hypothetical protein